MTTRYYLHRADGTVDAGDVPTITQAVALAEYAVDRNTPKAVVPGFVEVTYDASTDVTTTEWTA